MFPPQEIENKRKEERILKKVIALLIVLLFQAIFSLQVVAETQNLGTCLIDSLNGKERKQLAKWIYFAIAAHPEMAKFSNIKDDDRVETDKYIGKLVTRLLAEDCAFAAKIALKTDPLIIEKAFELVGQVAMQELMNNQSVNKAVTSYIKYADLNKLRSLVGEQ